MINQNRTLVLLAALVGVLVIVVAGLAYMVFQTNARLAGFFPASEASASATGEGKKDILTLPPSVQAPGQSGTWDPFGTPFDPGLWDPFSEMNEMHRRIDAMFNEAFGRFGKTPRFGDLLKEPDFTPRMDLADEGDHYVIQLDVPGAEEAGIEVSLENQTLTVEATTRLKDEEQEEDHTIWRERRIGRFQREIMLPEPVDANSMQTDYEDGVLTITIKKGTNDSPSQK